MMDYDRSERLELLKCFVSESRELLDDAEPQIIAMEEKALSIGVVDGEILNTIFRLFHSLKGSASFLNLQTIVSVTHEAETLLDIFRKGKASVCPGHVDLLIRTCDFTRNILDSVARSSSDEGFEAGAEIIIKDLQKAIASISLEATEHAGGPASCEKARANPEEPQEDTAPEDLADDLTINSEMTRRFVEENLELLTDTEKSLLALEQAPDNLEFAAQAYRNIHSVKGNAGFFGYSELETLSHHAETLLDVFKEGGKVCDSVSISFLLIAVDGLREGLMQIENGAVLHIPGLTELVEYLNKMAAGEGSETSVSEQNTHLCEQAEVAPRQGFELSSTEVHSNNRPCREVMEQRVVLSGGNEEDVKEFAEERNNAAVRERQLFSGQQQAIRVDIEKLDKLLDLVGELVISESMVANNQDLAGLHSDRFEKAVLQLDKITREIQEVAMSMRMIPLAGTFRKMMRLVRDLANKEDKKVSLEIIGEETEVDKTIIEQISDPLVHLVRNAVDHGIESPEERAALGKTETGKLTIEARHSAGEVWIIIEDDGRGLDREKILRKGIEKGLIAKEDRDLKDEEVWRLIFEPGFSTAEKVSNISGRGVGMDVVKRNIEKLRGKVDVRSKAGEGTVFIVRIPLTLAIIEGMVVKVGQARYTIPINSIKESLQPKEKQVTRTPDTMEIVRIRGELLPVIRLHELYKKEPGYKNLTEGILIVVESGEKKCCLFVDEVIGQQQVVIKGLSSYLGHVRSISGGAILGDGDISLIMDIADLINSVESVAV